MDSTTETLQPYLRGNGLDISKSIFIESSSKKVSWEIDNYFSLKSEGIETFDYILCDNLIQDTKYYRILIKEIFYALKQSGHLIIQYTPKSISLEDLEKELFFLMKDNIDIVQVYIENQICTIVAKKIKPNSSHPSGINNWSFGILTRGTTDNLVDEIIDTIKLQKIPNYEVIICGKYAGKYFNEVVYIEFTQKDDKGWITKKKNLICKKAKYENILVMHDRIKLNSDWFSGMK
jgi:hypothetical protein